MIIDYFDLNNLHDECPLVRRGRRADGVHRLHYAVQRRVRPDRHVGAAKVVVDGSHHADHVQVGARGALREDHYHHDVDHEIMIILYKRKGRGEGRPLSSSL